MSTQIIGDMESTRTVVGQVKQLYGGIYVTYSIGKGPHK